MSGEARIVTPLTKMLGIKHPILLAGMGIVSNAELVAAVCNAGGMGVLGGVSYSPSTLRKAIADLKSKLNDPKAPFGIDLLLPQVGGNARKTNKDYTVRHMYLVLQHNKIYHHVPDKHENRRKEPCQNSLTLSLSRELECL